jgi:hypothetical protein
MNASTNVAASMADRSIALNRFNSSIDRVRKAEAEGSTALNRLINSRQSPNGKT